MCSCSLISIIDDDYSVRESLQGLIRSVGFAAQVFGSGEEFLNSEHVCETDCLICDVRMPGINGLEVQRRLVSNYPDVSVVFITAHEDEIARSQALCHGAVDYLIKPFSKESLLNAIHAALRRNKLKLRASEDREVFKSDWGEDG